MGFNYKFSSLFLLPWYDYYCRYSCDLHNHYIVQALPADNWFRTGDLGVMDQRGYLKVVGRLKELIIRGGENIYPVEIEQVSLFVVLVSPTKHVISIRQVMIPLD